MITKKEVTTFQKKIFTWYISHKRDFPWRKTRDPYKILLSEVMSQQTQITRIIPKYEAWLKTFPTIDDLAKAKVLDVLRLWSGLGYNRRALYLQKTAQAIVERGEWPKSPEELEKLPGIGKYTSRAIACFAFGLHIPVVDTNIRKVIAHEFFLGVLPDERTVEEIAAQLLPKGKAYEWNQALMDYSANVLRDKKIPVPKQSRFLHSNRFFRGLLVRELLTSHEMTIQDTEKLLQKGIETFGESWLEPFLQQLEKDGFLTRASGKIQVKER